MALLSNFRKCFWIRYHDKCLTFNIKRGGGCFFVVGGGGYSQKLSFLLQYGHKFPCSSAQSSVKF